MTTTKSCFRKFVFFIAVISLLVNICPLLAGADSTEAPSFAEFSKQDSMNFVADHNIEIPEFLLRSDQLASFTQSIILRSSKYPDFPFVFNHDETLRYAEAIRLAVRDELIASGEIATLRNTTSYTLQYNTVQDSNGDWVTSGGYYNTKWLYYNCYAYAIERGEQPNFYLTGRQYRPGDMSGQGTFDDCADIDDLADLVREDLIAMGYSNISLSATIPTINSTQQLICVRRCGWDYHFMRYDIDTNAWYHKPGNTAILKYNFIPSNSYLWYAEYSDQGVESIANWAYDSDIVFITYSKNQINAPQSSSVSEYIQPGKDVFCEVNFATDDDYLVQLSSTDSFAYQLYDDDFDIILSGNGTSCSTCISVTAGKYHLRINFETNTTTLNCVDVLIEQHDHTFGPYRYYDHSSHIRRCSCGAEETEGHYALSTDIIDGRYVRCRGCRRLLDLTVDNVFIGLRLVRPTSSISSPVQVAFPIPASFRSTKSRSSIRPIW